MKKFSYFIPLVILAILAFYLIMGLVRNPQDLPSVLINKPIPTFELPPIKGKTKGFSKFLHLTGAHIQKTQKNLRFSLYFGPGAATAGPSSRRAGQQAACPTRPKMDHNRQSTKQTRSFRRREIQNPALRRHEMPCFWGQPRPRD